MNVLQARPPSQYSDELKRVISLISFPGQRVFLKGSASLASQRYFSDYDLITNLPKSVDARTAFDFFDNLLNRIEEDKWLFFVELKLQTRDGDKIRWYPKDEFEDGWKRFAAHYYDAEIIKLDIIDTRERVVEISCIYTVDMNVFDQRDFIEELLKDIEDLKKGGKYYKILKRAFSILRTIGGRSTDLVRLTDFFNSTVGEMYQDISTAEAVLKLRDFYPGDGTKRLVELVAKDLDVPSNNLKAWVHKKSAEVNMNAKQLADKFLAEFQL